MAIEYTVTEVTSCIDCPTLTRVLVDFYKDDRDPTQFHSKDFILHLVEERSVIKKDRDGFYMLKQGGSVDENATDSLSLRILSDSSNFLRERKTFSSRDEIVRVVDSYTRKLEARITAGARIAKVETDRLMPVDDTDRTGVLSDPDVIALVDDRQSPNTRP